MKPLIFSAPEELTAPRFAEAFSKGGGGYITIDPDTPMDGRAWAGFGSPQTWASLMRTMKAGLDFYYGDHGYFGRKKFYRVTKNRFQHTGIGEPDFKRLQRFGIAPQRRRHGAHIVVCPQSDNFHQRMGESEWLKRTVEKLKMYTDRRIIVRTKKDTRPLEVDLKNAHALVCYTSICSVEALIAGVPIFCTGETPATRFGLSDPTLIEYPVFPDRDEIMNMCGVLAANQWTMDEITAGYCWEKVK